MRLKAVWWATRGRYRRLEGAAFSGVDIDLSDLAPLAPA
jgi:hypothetical protein